MSHQIQTGKYKKVVKTTTGKICILNNLIDVPNFCSGKLIIIDGSGEKTKILELTESEMLLVYDTFKLYFEGDELEKCKI